MKKLTGTSFLIVLFAALVFGQTQAVAAVNSQADSFVITKRVSPTEQQAALALWTREELAAARPFPLPVDYGSPAVAAKGLEGFVDFHPFGSSSPPGKAAPNANKIARQAFPLDWDANNQAGSAALADFPADEPVGASQVYTSYNVNQWRGAQKVYPHRWIGRLSFTTPDGQSYCSATAISGNNIVTAAHCVYDTTTNTWYSNWMFTPAYRDGSAPFGSFRATACTILGTWADLSGTFQINTWTRHDVAVCTVRKNSAGTTLNAAVGWAGRQWNKGYERNFFNLGYPFRNTNNATIWNAGKLLRTCTAESFQQKWNTLGMGCNWGGGISGGPWLIGYALNNPKTGYVNSVNSGMFVNTDNLYGARFTGQNIVPLCNARGC